jgi:hypothetical protein
MFLASELSPERGGKHTYNYIITLTIIFMVVTTTTTTTTKVIPVITGHLEPYQNHSDNA